MLPFHGGFTGAVAADYQIERSLRFNIADTAGLNGLFGSGGNRKKWTFSCWLKRASFGVQQEIFWSSPTGGGSNDSDWFVLRFSAADKIGMNGWLNTWRLTTAVYRDPGAWMHLVLAVDTTLDTATDNERMRLYVNGVEVTTFDTLNNPALNHDFDVNVNTRVPWIGRNNYTGDAGRSPFGGYMADVAFVNDAQLTPSSFGETDSTTGVWKPKSLSGLTFGTNGFWLKFDDNSGTTSSTLGNDDSGNNNDWTPNNFSVTAGAGNDSLVDTPTNYGADTGVGGEVRGNYPTWNPLDKIGGGTASNGNLDYSNGAAQSMMRSTFAFPSQDKWYAECRCNTNTDGLHAVFFGVARASAVLNTTSTYTNMWGFKAFSIQRTETPTGGQVAGSGISAGDIMQIAFNASTGEIWIGKNNTWYDASEGTTGNPSTGANPTSTGLTSDVFMLVTEVYDASVSLNTGQRPFTHTAPTGFKALCTHNLPTPAIVKPSLHFDVNTRTSTGADPFSVTGKLFQPDLVWIKSRSATTDHAVYDSARGVEKRLETNNTDDEVTGDTTGLTAFNADGFTGKSLAQINTNTATYVDWMWDEGVTPGFDIVTYTGDGTNRTISHNLGVAPSLIIVKARTTAGANTNWPVYHHKNTAAPETDVIFLESVSATADDNTSWNDTVPTSSVFSVGTNVTVNTSGDTYVAYVFAEVSGFSKFGAYTGNGSADGPFAWCGFRPKWVLVKRWNSTSDWKITDSVRSTFNVAGLTLSSNTTGEAELDNDFADIDIVSNGFKVRATTYNASGGEYIFIAFAENPFKYARAR